MKKIILWALMLCVSACWILALPAGAAASEVQAAPAVEATEEAATTPTAGTIEEATTATTEEATVAPTAEATEGTTAAPTAEATEESTVTPTAEASEEATAAPTAETTEEAAAAPTEEATEESTAEPTEEATAEPTAEPTEEPAEETAEEETQAHYVLPIDFSPGMPLNDKYFVSELEYEDPTIKVLITRRSVENRYDYWIADIQIMDASQLRTASADGFDSDALAPPTKMAQRMNAVLAIDGDYFSYKGHDFVIRQGIVYLNHLNANRDILVIDEDGDFHGFLAPDRGEIGSTINGKKIINAFSFGPLLVNNGEIRLGGYSIAMADDKPSQRMAIAQVGHLQYRVICVGPYNGDSSKVKGLTLNEFRELVASMPDVQVAYNLDGGDSTFLIMNGKKINYVENVNARDGIRNDGIADIIYFASAWPEQP